MKTKNIFLIFLAILLTGCFSPVKTTPNSAYMLFRTPDSLPKKHTRAASILVLTPTASSAYDTTQMAYTTLPYKVSYFSENTWAETPSEMLQPLIVHTLQKSHYFKNVVSAPFVGHYDYLLSTQILILEQDFLHNPSVIRFKLRAQLSNAVTSRVLGTKEFSIVQSVRQNTPYSGVLAANAATSKILSQLAVFCAQHAR
jgi:cholesterol transport system auxiliary component